MTGGSQQLKFGETYAKSVKIRQSNLGKLDYPFFFQTQHIDKKTYTNDFKAFTYTYLHKYDMKRIGYNQNT
jgi:hypothetical protein